MKKDEKEWLRKLLAKELATPEAKPITESPATHNNPPKTVGGFRDIAGMEDLKLFLTESFINVLRNQQHAKAYGIKPPSVLLYGPYGCGKTFIVKKFAEEIGIKFKIVAPDDLASTYIHGTQEKIGELFNEAEKEAPIILFFDEFDSMVPKRNSDGNVNLNGEVNEFLCRINEAADKGVYVLAATNCPNCIDKAVLRTGRIDEIIYVGLPDDKARASQFRQELSKLPAAKDIDYERLAEISAGYNCSDISYIVKSASRKMFNASILEKDKPYKVITQALLEEIISGKAPSVSSSDLREFERLRCEFSPKDKDKQPQCIGFH